MIKGVEVEVEAEEVAEDAGVGQKKYEEPGPSGSAADFLLGEEMEGDPLGREEVEAAAIKINDSNKCQCLSSSIVSTTAVYDDQVAAVIDIDFNPHIDGGIPEDLLVDSSVDVNNAINQAETIVMHDHLSDILAQVDEDLLAPAVNVNIAVDDVQVFEATAPVDEDQVEDELSVDKHLPVKKTMPKRKHKFGKGARRGGNRKSCRQVDPTPLVARERPAADLDTSPIFIPVKRMNEKQRHWSLHCTKKKLVCAKKKAVTTSKKLTAAKAQCTILAKLAQDRRKESNLAHQKATSEVNAIRAEAEKRLHVSECEIADAKELCDKSVAEAQHKIIVEQVFVSTKAKAKAAITRKRLAKELLLHQRECDSTINGMKHMLRSALKRKDKMSSAILQKQAAKSRVIIKGYKSDNATQAAKLRVIIKQYERDNATSIATISNLEEKVATLDATLEQMKRSHKDALIDLMTTHRCKICSIHSQHFSNLLAEKKKQRIRMVNGRQLQNSLYDEMLDTRQRARDACKSIRSYDILSLQRLICMNEWRSKCSQIADNQDELVDRLCDMEVMEEQLQEYYDAAATSSNQIR